MGAESKIGLVAGKPLEILRPVFGNRDLKAQVIYRGPIPAPIKKGDVLAQLIISPDGLPEQSIPLLAAQDVATGGIFERVLTSARVLIRRFSQGSTTPEGAS
jgi:D-alanyl-D-alanine carboxypeptidase (penicillin-binding protein 5/6)